jgi:hypothetical protein
MAVGGRKLSFSNPARTLQHRHRRSITPSEQPIKFVELSGAPDQGTAGIRVGYPEYWFR